MKIVYLAACFPFAMLAGLSGWAAATVTVGNPKQPQDLAPALQAAYQQGRRDITIAAGRYDIPKGAPSLSFNGWHDATIQARGVTLIFEDLKPEPVYFGKCTNVTWNGGILQFAEPAATQGRITAIEGNAQGHTCEWRIDAGYPMNIDPKTSLFDVVDAKTRVLKVGTGDWTPASVEALGKPGAYRLHYSGEPGFAVNDWLITRAPGGAMTVHFDNCQNCTLENVTFWNGGFGTMFDTGGAGGNHYLKCTIEPGPRPPGATEDQLVGCGADGLHCAGDATGPDIEDCHFRGVFHDDCIAIHGGFGRVIRSDGNKLVLKGNGGDPVVGEPLRISDTHGFFAQAMVTAIVRDADGNAEVTLDQNLNVPIDHSQDADDKLGTKANNPDRCGRGYKILRCRLGDTRSRGILVKADDGLIEGCTIEGCGMPGVSIGPEFWWGEANYCWNVTVANNVFRQCLKDNGDTGTIWVHTDGAMGNRNITIKNNVFETCYGKNIFDIEGTHGATIFHNKISHSFTVKPSGMGHILQVKQSKNIHLADNKVDDQGRFAGDLIDIDPGVSESEIHAGSTGGFSVKNSTGF